MSFIRLHTGQDGRTHIEEMDLASHPELGATPTVGSGLPPG